MLGQTKEQTRLERCVHLCDFETELVVKTRSRDGWPTSNSEEGTSLCAGKRAR